MKSHIKDEHVFLSHLGDKTLHRLSIRLRQASFPALLPAKRVKFSSRDDFVSLMEISFDPLGTLSHITFGMVRTLIVKNITESVK
jgi:hypothetical protein